MKKNRFSIQILILILAASGFMACATPDVKIQQDQVYEQGSASLPVPEYLLGPGDQIEVFFSFATQPTEELYRLAVGDILRVEFNYHKELNRELTVQPDGGLVLPFEGQINVAGLSTTELSVKITHMFSKRFKDPVVTVTLIQFNQARVEFQAAIRSDGRGQSRVVRIRPDGIANFPLIEDIEAAGKTVFQVREAVRQQYNEKLDNIEVSLILAQANSNLVYVLGEVNTPNYFRMDTPTTVSQILARAGVKMASAELSSILVISRNSENNPIGRIFNLEEVLSYGNIGNDFLLRQYDIVYVPQNKITQAGAFVDQYLNSLVPQFFRTTLGFSYDLKE